MGQGSTSCASKKGTNPKGTLKFAGAKPKTIKEKAVGYGEDEVFHGVNVGQARFELCRCVRRDSEQTGHMTTTCGTEDNNL